MGTGMDRIWAWLKPLGSRQERACVKCVILGAEAVKKGL